MFITFLTDFGLQDDFVGTCHGVMKRIAPAAQIIDITHGIRPGRILQGALVLANTLAYMPAGVHLAVVDPGVGGSRRPLVLQDGEGRLYVGPDNGLLLPAVDRYGNVSLNLTREQLEDAEIVPGTRVELGRGGNRWFAVAARTFGDARAGELILYEDSYRNVAVAVARGSAADLLGVDEGSDVTITPQ